MVSGFYHYICRSCFLIAIWMLVPSAGAGRSDDKAISAVSRSQQQVKASLPEYYQKMPHPEDAGMRLGYYIVERNGERIILENGTVLRFIRGDLLRVTGVVLKNGEKNKRTEVNVVGFRAKTAGEDRQDLGQFIDTASYLNRKYWSINNEGDTYAVVAARDGQMLGMASLQRVEPKLQYVDIRLNDQIRVMREGQLIRMNASDQFKVEKIVTNLKNLDHVHYRLLRVSGEALTGQKNLPDHVGAYKLIFQHRSYEFAAIPMLVESL
ncbi:MAG: hypothetical protein H6618_02105 [Deltaproteobacteria bacterium]|nr:hypothetical protein [Deltaproteobacteria bacterium]